MTAIPQASQKVTISMGGGSQATIPSSSKITLPQLNQVQVNQSTVSIDTAPQSISDTRIQIPSQVSAPLTSQIVLQAPVVLKQRAPQPQMPSVDQQTV